MDISGLSSLPTDSLYKFMALSGVLILISTIMLYEILIKNFVFKLLEAKKVSKIEKEKIRVLIEEAERIKTEISKLKEKFEENKAEGQDIDRASQLEKNVDELAKKQALIYRSICKQECTTSQIDYLANRLSFIKPIYLAAILVGLFLSGAGFYLWYVKLQVFVDAAIQLGK